MYLKGRLVSGIFGLCVGDALGVPVEFSIRTALKNHPINNMTGYGTHNQPPGTWSDDSSLAFCLAESLCEGYDLLDIANKFVAWYEEGYWTPRGEVFDVGNATLQAINRIKRGSKPIDAGGKTEYDNGNGSLMRILPLAYYLLPVTDIRSRIEIVHNVSAITHAHIRAQMACVFYIEIAVNLLKGLNFYDAYSSSIEVFNLIYRRSGHMTELKHFQRITAGDIKNLNEDSILSSGYVIHTLEASIWCILNGKDYKDTVLKAVNLGDDTDTTAAVTGGLAGIYYGFSAIPNDWINILARKDDISNLCERFANKLIF